MIKLRVFLLLLTTPIIALAQDPPASQDSEQAKQTTAFIKDNKNIRYVDDTLVIVMRAGDGNNYKVIRSLSSGTPLQYLQSSGEFSRVRASDGTEGWVLTRYLSKAPIAREQLKNANQQLAKLTAQNKELTKELNTTTKENATLSDENRKLNEQIQNFRTVAAKPIELQEENQSLTKAKVSLENDKQMLEQEVQVLRDQSDKRWFLAGAGVLLCGMFLGLMIPKMRRRRKSDWSSL